MTGKINFVERVPHSAVSWRLSREELNFLKEERCDRCNRPIEIKKLGKNAKKQPGVYSRMCWCMGSATEYLYVDVNGMFFWSPFVIQIGENDFW